MDDRYLDFRLLECLQVLVAERHVTKAAERLGMSQPKLSSALARLRRITGDPLMVRTPEGMIPTSIARDLASQSADFMVRWRDIAGASQTSFEPEKSERTFRILVTDIIVQRWMIPVISHLRIAAPRVAISIMSPVANMREHLETGEADLLIGYVPDAPQELFMSHLTSSEPCIIAAASHPRVRNELSLDAYIEESHVIGTFGRNSQPLLTERYVDAALAERKLARKAAVYAPSLIIIPEIVAATDLLAVVSRRLAEQTAKRLQLQFLSPPFAMPSQEISMIWHARTKNGTAHRWFRNAIRTVALRALAEESAHSDVEH